MAKLVEHVVEELRRVEPTQSYFVELDGPQLILKRFDRGKGPYVTPLRATGVPFGSYEVVGTRVVHRYDPTTILREVTRHQQLLRMQTPAFRGAVTEIAKRAGGRVSLLESATIGPTTHLGYRIRLKRPAKLDVRKLAATHTDAALVLFVTAHHYEGKGLVSELGVLCADTIADAICMWIGENVRPLIELLVSACGPIEIIEMRSRILELRLARAPKQPAPIVKALMREIDQGEGARGANAWKQVLASRELLLRWDY